MGIDISGRLISRVRQIEQSEGLGIRYVHADIAAPHAIPDGEFDAAACSFGLSDIDDLDAAITAIAPRSARAGASSFRSCTPVPRREGHSGLVASLGELQRRRTLDAAGGPFRAPAPGRANHRMLSAYLNTLRSHDLWIDRIAEPTPEPGWDPAHDADRKPVHLVARSIKLTER